MGAAFGDYGDAQGGQGRGQTVTDRVAGAALGTVAFGVVLGGDVQDGALQGGGQEAVADGQVVDAFLEEADPRFGHLEVGGDRGGLFEGFLEDVEGGGHVNSPLPVSKAPEQTVGIFACGLYRLHSPQPVG
jgi:hypothetical protein